MSEEQEQASVVALVTFISSFYVLNTGALNWSKVQGSPHPLPSQDQRLLS